MLSEWSGRIPDQIMTDFENEVRAGNVAHAHDILWEILADVSDSYELAMKNTDLDDEQRQEVHDTVTDYLTNHYGED